MTCKATGESGATCVLPEGQHLDHWDGKAAWWSNEGYRPPPSRKKPGRARADRTSKSAVDLVQSVRQRLS